MANESWKQEEWEDESDYMPGAEEDCERCGHEYDDHDNVLGCGCLVAGCSCKGWK